MVSLIVDDAVDPFPRDPCGIEDGKPRAIVLEALPFQVAPYCHQFFGCIQIARARYRQTKESHVARSS